MSSGHRDDGTSAERREDEPQRRPQKMEDYLGRLIHPPKRDYATALSDAIMSGSEHPEAPTAPWAADVQRKTVTYMGGAKKEKPADAPATPKKSGGKSRSGSFNPVCGTCKGSGINHLHKAMFGSTVACGSCKGDGMSPRGRKFVRDEIGE